MEWTSKVFFALMLLNTIGFIIWSMVTYNPQDVTIFYSIILINIAYGFSALDDRTVEIGVFVCYAYSPQKAVYTEQHIRLCGLKSYY